MSENNKQTGGTGGADQKEKTSQPGTANPGTGKPGTEQPRNPGKDGSEDGRKGAEETKGNSNSNTQK